MPTLYDCDLDYYIDKFVYYKYGQKLEWFTIDIPKKNKKQNYTEVYLYFYNGKTLFDDEFDCTEAQLKLKIREKLQIRLKVTNTRKRRKNVSIK